MIRTAFIALALIAVPAGTLAVPGCTTLEQVKPETPRQALAEAEIMFVGVVQSATMLAQAGYLRPEQIKALDQTFTRIAAGLNAVHVYIQQGDLLKAAAELDAISPDLAATARQLSELAEIWRNNVADPQ